jgi:hypothetical protein
MTRNPKPTAADHRTAIAQAAQTDSNYRVLQARMANRAAGMRRQMTTEEIAQRFYGKSAASILGREPRA